MANSIFGVTTRQEILTDVQVTSDGAPPTGTRVKGDCQFDYNSTSYLRWLIFCSFFFCITSPTVALRDSKTLNLA
jgi:hypothetical protein